MQKKKEIDIYAEARSRSALIAQSLVDALFEEAARKAERERELGRARSKKYARTEKGKNTNARKCKRYQLKHRKEIIAYVKRWQEDFFKRYGMKYGTYLYRKKHGIPVPAIKKAPA